MPRGTKWERNIPPTIAPLYDHTAAVHNSILYTCFTTQCTLNTDHLTPVWRS
ncbi:hypothetical protein DEU56DRAFT_181355 [Suillus clintonianus]|uniref:uncharacterized protein n=1 Tax=Suillus clintonianus TaxID=1904413 RepID=UPI001B85F3F4|nr:uncharacterized protein DEU56DRAFT_181355 [Suillus clintonianus]KAG2145773.1 hypothetical protein DEU56DRAFT_181355 [Suillus clintonianus]